MSENKIPFKPRVERKYIGQYSPRTDGLTKASGKAMYTDDMTAQYKYPNMLYMRMLKSPYPHAKIKSIDTSAAEALPGVVAILKYDDPVVESWPWTSCTFSDSVGTWTKDQSWTYGVFDRKILGTHAHWVGDELGVAVAATSQETAEEAIALMKVDWEVLPFVLTYEDAIKPDAPILHPEVDPTSNYVPIGCADENGVIMDKGDFDKAYEEAEVKIEAESEFYNAQQAAMEYWSGMVDWNDDGMLVLSDSYAVDQTRWSMHDFFGVPLKDIRVITPFQGGQHGRADTNEQYFYFVCAELSRRTGCPVKYRATRKEAFHDCRNTMLLKTKLGSDKEGNISAMKMEIIANEGAYLDLGEGDVTLSVDVWLEGTPYNIPNIKVVGTEVYTNIIPSSCMRSVGNVGCNYIFGLALDMLAEELDMDPAELYIKNCSCEGIPAPNPCLEEVVRKGCKELGWENRHKAGEGPLIDGTKKRGMGFCVGDTWHVERYEYRRGNTQIMIKLNPDGTCLLDAPTVEVGTGSNHCAVLAAAEGAGIHPDQFKWISNMDTENTLKDEVQSDSAVSYILSEAAYEAGLKLKERFLKQVAHRFDVESWEELDMNEGVVFVKADPLTRITVAEYFETVELMQEDTLRPVTIYHERPLSQINNGVAYMGAFADVEVDTTTGEVDVKRLIVASDGGTILNPAGADGQLVGGQCMGIGESLFERMIYDPNTGIPLNFNMIDYKFPTIEDFPDVDPMPMEVYKDGAGNFSCSGIGEGAPSCTPRAVANAIYNAIGVRVNGSAISPKDILKALGKAGA